MIICWYTITVNHNKNNCLHALVFTPTYSTHCTQKEIYNSLYMYHVTKQWENACGVLRDVIGNNMTIIIPAYHNKYTCIFCTCTVCAQIFNILLIKNEELKSGIQGWHKKAADKNKMACRQSTVTYIHHTNSSPNQSSLILPHHTTT